MAETTAADRAQRGQSRPQYHSVLKICLATKMMSLMSLMTLIIMQPSQ